MNQLKFKVTSGLFQKFVHVQMLIDDLENLFGILNVQTRTDSGLLTYKVVVYITIIKLDTGRGYPSTKEVEAWWETTDKSGKNYKIERIDR